jgi:TP901 family phage tail tape measure protein
MSLGGEIARLFVSIGVKTEEFVKGLNGVQDKLQNFGAKMMKTGGVITAGVTVPIVAGVALIGKLANEAIGFEQQMNEVFTLLPKATESAMAQMSDDVLEFSKQMGIIPTEVAPALYQAISAGVPADNVFSFMEVAAKAAIGGVTDLETAVDGISTVINSYGAEVMDAGKASDLMFTAVRLGKTTFEELSASLFNVLPSASSLGVSFEEVTAAMSTMTAQGVPTSVATTQMRQLLVELSKEGGKAAGTFQQLAGKSFKDFVASGGNVSDALAIMNAYAEETGVSVSDMFGSVEAGNAALQLSGENAATYNAHLAEMQGAAGATDAAFQQMEQGVGRQMEKLKAEFAAAKIEIGDKFLPVIVDTLMPILREQFIPILGRVAEALKVAAEWFGSLSPGMQQTILAGIALIAALGPVLMIIGAIATGISALIPVFAFLLSPIGLIIIAIAALVAGILYLWNTNEGFRNAVIAIWEAIKAKGMAIFGALQAFWEQHGEAIKTVFQAAWDQIKNIFTTVFAIIGGIVKFWAAVFQGDVSGALEAAKGIFSTAWNFIVGSVRNFATALGAVWGTIKSAASAAWSGIVTAIKTKANEIRTSVITAVNAAITWLKGLPGQMTTIGRNIIQGIINGIRNMGSSLAGALKGIVDAAIRNVKRLLGISSPSKVFEGFGINVGAGFVSGIEGMQGAVGNAMQGMVSPEMSIAAEASNSSTMVIKHEIDLKNVPATVDGASLENSLMNMLNNPQIKRRLDRISYENTVAARGLGI